MGGLLDSWLWSRCLCKLKQVKSSKGGGVKICYLIFVFVRSFVRSFVWWCVM